MMKQRIIIGFLCICLASMAFAQERIRIEHGPYFAEFERNGDNHCMDGQQAVCRLGGISSR